MPRLVHLSDIHVGLKYLDDDYGNDAKLFEYIKTNHAGDTILITGDLVDNGWKKEYDRLDKLVKGVKNLAAVPGNHDYGTLGLNYSSRRVIVSPSASECPTRPIHSSNGS